MLKHVVRTYIQIRPVRGKKRSIGLDTKAILEKVDIKINPNSQFIYFIDTQKTIAVSGNIISNFTLDYDKVIHNSFESLKRVSIGNSIDEYAAEAVAVIEGIEELRRRIIKKIEKSTLSNEIKALRKRDFINILKQPAEHFDEALQRILFFNQILWQTRHRLNGLGRLDKILYDYFKADTEAGILTYDEASCMVRDFLIQLSHYSEYKSDALKGDIGQIIILGGLEENRTYFYNELTQIFLKEQAKLKKPDPKIVLRVSKDMPDGLLRVAIKSIMLKNGSPLLSNDDIVIPTLIDFGMPEEDAYNYCTSACWEVYIVGKSLDQNNIAVFDFFKALNKVIEENDKYKSFDHLLDSYIYSNKECFKAFLCHLDQFKWAKDPLVSMFTEGCNEKRLDISEGVAKYNNYGITTVALANVVDSLLNIKKLVFDSKQITLHDLNLSRLNNFENDDAIYKIIQKCPKSYGHDEMETISLSNRITESIAIIAKEYRNVYGGTVKFGVSSPGYNILSKKTIADFSGRKRGMPYNTHISCMDATYIELVNFAAGLNYNKQRFNGNVVDFFITAEFISENFEKFVLFMKGAIRKGFFQMQMNIMDSKTLKEAKENPEKYVSLIVRVWGFSSYFNDLPESYKDLLIERAIAAEKIAKL